MSRFYNQSVFERPWLPELFRSIENRCSCVSLLSCNIRITFLSSTDSLLGGDPFSNLGDITDFDLSPLSSSDLLNGEGLPLPLECFINLSPPHSYDYHFGLEDHEGISELFDCDFGDLSNVLGDG